MKTKEEVLREHIDQASKKFDIPPYTDEKWAEFLTFKDTITMLAAMESYAAQFKEKAERWDKLYSSIEKIYFDENGNPRPHDDKSGGDLTNIGEIAAIHLGFL